MKRTVNILAAAAVAATISVPAMAHEAGNWVLRAGVGSVQPKSDNLSATLDLGDGVTASAAVDVDSATSLVLSGTYMFTPNWAFDILASWPFEHDINLVASITEDGQTETASLNLGSTKQLPPTFSVQYHFLPDATFQPYAGLGLNYTTFFSESISAEGQELGVTGLSLDDSFGVAGQLGADWVLNEQWLINFDVRYIQIGSDAKLTLDSGADAETFDLGTVDIDPWVYAVNVGFRF